jgi:hypothetical protein
MTQILQFKQEEHLRLVLALPELLDEVIIFLLKLLIQTIQTKFLRLKQHILDKLNLYLLIIICMGEIWELLQLKH